MNPEPSDSVKPNTEVRRPPLRDTSAHDDFDLLDPSMPPAAVDEAALRAPFTADEEETLRAALALDADELTFLASAALPDRVLAMVQSRGESAAIQAAVERPAALGSFFLALAGVAAFYAGWLLSADMVRSWIALARQLGAGSLVARTATGLAMDAIDTLASLVEAASRVPGFGEPLLPLSLLALIGWLTLSATQRRRLPGAEAA